MSPRPKTKEIATVTISKFYCSGIAYYKKGMTDSTTDVVKTVALNHILFYAAISMSSIAKLRACLLELVHGTTRPKTIKLHIFSTGGCAYAGLCGHDMIRTCPIPVHTIVEGEVCSAATLLSIAGQHRSMLENASYVIHHLRTDFTGSFHALKVDLKNATSMTNQCIAIYMRATGLSSKRVQDLMKDDTQQTADECLSTGFIDEIVRPYLIKKD